MKNFGTRQSRKNRHSGIRMMAEMLLVSAMALSMSIAVVAAAVNTGTDTGNTTVISEEAKALAEEIVSQDPIIGDQLPTTIHELVPGVAVASLTTETPIEAEPAVDTVPTITTTRLGVKVTSYDPDANYTAIIDDLYSTIEGETDSTAVDHILGLLEIYEAQRNLKVQELYAGQEGYNITNIFTAENSLEEIDDIMNPPFYNYTQEELLKLAAVVYAEAGSSWATDEHQQAVASVVLNRILDPRFPDNVFDVVYADRQYPGTCNATYYTDRTLANAQYVLENGPTHDGVWQANFPQGDETILVYQYSAPIASTTYICR